MSKAEAVINCGDAGQEGELIQRWVMQKAGCKCPVYRLWISSLTEESIREGFENLKKQEDFNTLYEAGLSRAIGDWLLGMNATRLYTLKYGQNKQVLSIGRVQTPTLALIVNRQLEIDNFVSQPYWELKTIYRETVFSVTKGRFQTVEEGETFLQEVLGIPFEVTDVSKKQGKEAPANVPICRFISFIIPGSMYLAAPATPPPITTKPSTIFNARMIASPAISPSS